MNTADQRASYLDICDASLVEKPHLSEVFHPEWRRGFRAEALSRSSSEIGYPPTYWMPMLKRMCPGLYPNDLQARVEFGLQVVWPRLDQAGRDHLASRLRGSDGLAAEDELLAASGFALEFTPGAISVPNAAGGKRRPEFVVDASGLRLPVECKYLLDQQEVGELNEMMMRSGQSWVQAIDPQIDRDRLRRAIVRKLHRNQGGTPPVLITTAYTPWLFPDDMAEVVRLILTNPDRIRVDQSVLPIGIVCLSWKTVQGIWFCDTMCAEVGVSAEQREGVRRAVLTGFVPRPDGQLLSERDW